MLDRLIKTLQAGGTYSLNDLARELGTTPALVEMMLESLSGMGYVERGSEGCAGACGGCSQEGCHTPLIKSVNPPK